MYDFFISCPKGLEELLAQEAEQLGFEARLKLGGIVASLPEGDFYRIYQFCIASRLANRVVWILSEFTPIDKDMLYRQVYNTPWMQHFTVDKTIAVEFRGTNRFINNSHYGAMLVKDAVVDHFNHYVGERPSVNAKEPDIEIYCHLGKKQVMLGIEISGGSLHKRGYRLKGAKAPLKENLAAALMLRARQFSSEGKLIDPFCGSATLLIEGVLADLNIAVNSERGYFGFESLKKHSHDAFTSAMEAARASRQQAIEQAEKNLAKGEYLAYGYDADERAIEAARDNIQRAGLQRLINIEQRSIHSFKRPKIEQALLVMNPPYGERLSEREKLLELYATIGTKLKSQCQGDAAAILSSDNFLLKNIGLQKKKRYKFYNGKLESEWMLFKLYKKDESQADKLSEQASDSKSANIDSPDSKTVTHPWGQSVKNFDNNDRDKSAIEMVANRLRKNHKRLNKWAKKNDIFCYRLYDADMPEYAFALDIYDGRYQLTEYIAPKSVDEFAAFKRKRHFIQACLQVYSLEKEQLIIKERRQQKGSEQYQKVDQRGRTFTVTEGAAQFEINLHDYLDTGLFLDHRPIRLDIAKRAAGKSFLNLFCYTATASVHAAVGGALKSDSVDMSQTYINWSERNFKLNKLDLRKHQLHRANVLEWVDNNRNSYDVIFVDPPSFSNSKRMDNTWDVQRDHAGLLHKLMKSLNSGGELIFSNNLRRFKLDKELEESYHVEDISKQTIDEDFARNQHIHQCWVFKQK